MRSPRLALVVIAAALCLGNLIFSLLRSTIPIGLDGTVDNVEFLTSKNPGIDDIYVLSVDGNHIHVDKDVARLLRRGARISKDPWSTELTIGEGDSGGVIQLRPSSDFTGMLVTTPVVILVLLILLRQTKGASASTGPRRSAQEGPKPPASGLGT